MTDPEPHFMTSCLRLLKQTPKSIEWINEALSEYPDKVLKLTTFEGFLIREFFTKGG